MIRFNNVKGLNRLTILIISGLILSSILIFGYNYYQKSNYPKLQVSDSTSGKVIKSSKYQSVILVDLDNGEKYMLIDSKNYTYNPSSMQDFLKKGDFIEKKVNSDTIQIIRASETYFFVIGEDINKYTRENN